MDARIDIDKNKDSNVELKSNKVLNKYVAIKSAIRAVNLILAGIIETKVENCELRDIIAFGGDNDVVWEVSPAINRAGGLLLLWDNSAVTINNVFTSQRWVCLDLFFLQHNVMCAMSFTCTY